MKMFPDTDEGEAALLELVSRVETEERRMMYGINVDQDQFVE